MILFACSRSTLPDIMTSQYPSVNIVVLLFKTSVKKFSINKLNSVANCNASLVIGTCDDFNLLTSLNMMSNSLSITSSPNPAAGTLPTVGGLRTLNNSTSVSSRNVAGTQDLLLLGTDGSDRIIHGSLALNKGHIFDTAVVERVNSRRVYFSQ